MNKEYQMGQADKISETRGIDSPYSLIRATKTNLASEKQPGYSAGYRAGVGAKTDLLSLLREAREALHSYRQHRNDALLARIDAALEDE